jgi:hypothetical protein
MSRFVQLNSVAHGPFDLRAEKIDGIIDAGDGGHTTIAFAGMQIAVTESREQILALLDALDAPGTAEVTEARLEVTKEVTDAAWTAWLADRGTMEDAIVAADRARGLRP